MIYIVKPTQHSHYKNIICSYLLKLEQTTGKKLSDDEQSQTTYIIHKDEQRGVTGGICLQSKNLQNFSFTLSETLKPICENYQIWQCSDLLFDLPEDDPSFLTEGFDSLCRHFYRNMYEALVNFSILQKTLFLLSEFPQEEYQDSVYFGFWPYKNYVFKGYSPYKILSLHPHDYTKFQHDWRSYEHQDLRLSHKRSMS